MPAMEKPLFIASAMAGSKVSKTGRGSAESLMPARSDREAPSCGAVVHRLREVLYVGKQGTGKLVGRGFTQTIHHVENLIRPHVVVAPGGFGEHLHVTKAWAVARKDQEPVSYTHLRAH